MPATDAIRAARSAAPLDGSTQSTTAPVLAATQTRTGVHIKTATDAHVVKRENEISTIPAHTHRGSLVPGMKRLATIASPACSSSHRRLSCTGNRWTQRDTTGHRLTADRARRPADHRPTSPSSMPTAQAATAATKRMRPSRTSSPAEMHARSSDTNVPAISARNTTRPPAVPRRPVGPRRACAAPLP